MDDKIMIPVSVRADLNQGIKKTYLDQVFSTNDDSAHRIDVQLLRGNEQAIPTESATVVGYFIRYSDNATISLTGSLDGNVASVTMKKSCYNRPGAFALIVKVQDGDSISTVFYGEGTVYVSSTDTIVDEENVIPSLDDLLAQIAVMETATQAANDAAAQAISSAANADTATDSANRAAAAIDGMTVSAESTTSPSVSVSDVDGVKHVKFGLVTPNITFVVATGAEGTDVLVEQSGTAEAPTVKLTIPRGNTGSVDSMPYYTGTPVVAGTPSAGTSEYVARGDHAHPSELTDGCITNSMMADAPALTVKGNAATAEGAVQDMTAKQLWMMLALNVVQVGDGLAIDEDGKISLTLADGDEVNY